MADERKTAFRRSTTGNPSAASLAEQGSSGFDRFKNLTSKLVRVPKTELDEQRKKS